MTRLERAAKRAQADLDRTIRRNARYRQRMLRIVERLSWDPAKLEAWIRAGEARAKRTRRAA
jgi:hypothetical protein